MAVTPNMLIPIDVPGSTAGPPSFQWATDLELFKTIVDNHQHLGTAGSGLQLGSASLNINTDLSWNSNNLTTARSVRFVQQASALVGSNDKGCVYDVLGDLWWNNASGVAVQITAGSSLNPTGVGGITGLGGTTAAVTYSSGLTDFIFTSNTAAAAAIDCGAVTIRQTASANAHGITLKSPNALAADYNLTLPTGLPASTYPLTVDSTGVIAAAPNGLQVAKVALATATTPDAGNQVMYVDSLSLKVSGKVNGGGSYPLYMQVANTANIAAFSTVETIIAGSKTGGANAPQTSFQIPANTLAVGSVIRVKIYGFCTSSVANTVTFRLRIGTNGTTADGLVLHFPFVAATAGTNAPFVMTFTMTVTAIGASANFTTTSSWVELLNNANPVAGVGVSAFTAEVKSAVLDAAFNSTVAEYITLSALTAAATTTLAIGGATMELV